MGGSYLVLDSCCVCKSVWLYCLVEGGPGFVGD